MAVEIKLPRLDWNMEQGTFIGWLKKPGESVNVGDALYTLEGDKAVQEIEATDAGILRLGANPPKEGEKIPVGTVLGYLLEAGESLPQESPPPAPSSTTAVSMVPAPASPSVRRLAREMGIDVEQVRGTGVTGRITVEDVKAHAQPKTVAAKAEVIPSRKAITPRARHTATKLGIDVSELAGSGRNGRVRERDVMAASSNSERKPTTSTDDIKIRRVIAERMKNSLQTTAPVTLHTRVDVTNLVNARQQFKSAAASGPPVPTITDLFVKLTARALKAHPRLNSRWEESGIVTLPNINIGLAVDTEAGLLVPVVRDADQLSLRQISNRSKELIEKARHRNLPADALRGGTFTITNLGTFGIDAFTPIINWPECAILGLGRIVKEPVVVEDKIVIRETITLSLTFDHRIVDGAPAARFLQTLSQALENPIPWLVD